MEVIIMIMEVYYYKSIQLIPMPRQYTCHVTHHIGLILYRAWLFLTHT